MRRDLRPGQRQVAIAPQGLAGTTPADHVPGARGKQWTKVGEAIKAKDDVLIIAGYPAYEPRHAGITIYALSVTTKQQQAKREAQQAEAG